MPFSLYCSCLFFVDGWSLVEKKCESVCPSGNFNSSAGCQPCHSTCLVCNGPTDKNCLSCSDIKFLNLQTNQCFYDCPEGQFGDLETTHCKPCSSGCKKCNNYAECLSCQSGLLLVGNSCQTQCPPGQFRTKTNSCEPCDGMCKECSLSATHCIKCQDHDVLSDGSCVSICPVGTFLQFDTKSCVPCHPSCKTCTGLTANDCTGCKGGSVVVNSRCLASCPSDYYFNKEANRCQQCDYYCSTCNGGKLLLLGHTAQSANMRNVAVTNSDLMLLFKLLLSKTAHGNDVLQLLKTSLTPHLVCCFQSVNSVTVLAEAWTILQNTGPLFLGIYCYVVPGKVKHLILTSYGAFILVFFTLYKRFSLGTTVS